jgi:hypothetical protein
MALASFSSRSVAPSIQYIMLLTLDMTGSILRHYRTNATPAAAPPSTAPARAPPFVRPCPLEVELGFAPAALAEADVLEATDDVPVPAAAFVLVDVPVLVPFPDDVSLFPTSPCPYALVEPPSSAQVRPDMT